MKKDGIQLLASTSLQEAMNMGNGKIALFKALEALASRMYLLVKMKNMKVHDKYCTNYLKPYKKCRMLLGRE